MRIGYNKYANAPGVVVYRPAISYKEIDLTEGTWYFHAQDKIGGQWGPLATFALHITASSTAAAIGTTTVATSSAIAPSVTVAPRPAAISLWLLLGIIAFAILAGLIAGLLLGAAARRHVRHLLAVRHAHALLTRHFDELKEAVSQEIAALEKVRSRRSLTEEEERLINRLSRLLDRAEHEIERELFGKGEEGI